MNLGIPKGSAHQSLSVPQEEHLAAWAKKPSCLLPAHQEPPSQSRVEPCMTTHRVPVLSVCSPDFSERVPPLQGWKSLPCELSHRSAMQPSLQLCCHRHDSGHPAPVTPHTSQMIGFLTWETFFAMCCLKAAPAASHCLGWGTQGYWLLPSLVPTGTTRLEPCCVISQL